MRVYLALRIANHNRAHPALAVVTVAVVEWIIFHLVREDLGLSGVGLLCFRREVAHDSRRGKCRFADSRVLAAYFGGGSASSHRVLGEKALDFAMTRMRMVSGNPPSSDHDRS